MAFAILSRKVLLRSVLPYTATTFSYALVVVSGEEVQEVIELQEDLTVQEVLRRYPKWRIDVRENDYVLPGLVDLQVRCNGDWGNAETESRAAVSGGVTFFLEEPSVHQKHLPPSRLYCDVGACELLHSSDPVQELAAVDSTAVFAAKAYLSPPSAYCAGVKEHLSALTQTPCKALLMLDCFIPPESSLRVNSPFRLNSLEDREHEQLSSRLSSGDGFSNEVTPYPEDVKSASLPPAPEKHERRTSCSEVVDELHKYRKLKGHQESYEVLSKISLLGYRDCGVTSFQKSEETAVANVLKVPLRMRRRPSAISVVPVRSIEMDEYVVYYGQYLEDTETVGVEQLIEGLKANGNTAKCRIHVANMCSAMSICSLVDYKTDFQGALSVDSAPHYLYYTQDQVDAGNTRFKVSPPIRCRENQEFLWKLLRAGGIDTVSSNHTSVALDYKFLSTGNFKRAVCGFASLGFTLQALVTKGKRQTREEVEADLLLFSIMMSTNPASLIRISSKRGSISPQKYADLVIFSLPDSPSRQPSLAKYPDLSPFASESLCGSVKKVFVRGKVAYEDGQCFPVGRAERPSDY